MKKDEVGLTILVTGVIVPFITAFVNYATDVIIDAIEKGRKAKAKKKVKKIEG
jgi:hypothetical protein